jgi:rhodanese-related sulfurtransferase
MQQASLIQQGYDYTPAELNELTWALRFTPSICMAVAIVGLATAQPAIHFGLAALGMLPFGFPSAHPVDNLYNRLLRPLWDGVRLPPNPLPRRIACFMGGAMNLGIGIAFVGGSPVIAYALGGVLIALQLVVISSHFCLASWMFERALRMMGRWTPPIAPERAREITGAGGVLIDVRNPDEFARGHLEGARNAPLDGLPGSLDEPRDRPLVVYCHSGLRGQEAARVLKGSGYTNVHNLGAMARWDA